MRDYRFRPLEVDGVNPHGTVRDGQCAVVDILHGLRFRTEPHRGEADQERECPAKPRSWLFDYRAIIHSAKLRNEADQNRQEQDSAGVSDACRFGNYPEAGGNESEYERNQIHPLDLRVGALDHRNDHEAESSECADCRHDACGPPAAHCMEGREVEHADHAPDDPRRSTRRLHVAEIHVVCD